MRILIAGMGNVLAGDDGFGVAVANELMRRSLPPCVEVTEVGIGGMHLVQTLMDGYDGLVIVDAVDRGAAPGTLFLLSPRIPAPAELSSHIAATHHTVPAEVLAFASALGVLPGRIAIVGCQPGSVDELGMTLTPAVQAAVSRAAAQIERLAREFADAPS